MRILVLFTVFIAAVLSQITYPKNGTVWKVGQSARVSFKQGQPGETVSIFFDHDRSTNIGGGPITRGGTFKFTVSPKSVNPAGGPARLVVVHRVNGLPHSVDTIQVRVVH